MCQIPNGCIMHEPSGACPLCHEDGADRIAEWQFEQDFKERELNLIYSELMQDFKL